MNFFLERRSLCGIIKANPNWEVHTIFHPTSGRPSSYIAHLKITGLFEAFSDGGPTT